MLPRIPILFLIFLIAGLYRSSSVSADLLKHQLTVTLEPQRHLLEGESLLQFRPSGNSISFALAPHAAIEEISVDGRRVRWHFSKGAGSVSIPAKGKESILRIRYRVAYDDPLPSRFVSGEDPSYGISGVVSSKGAFLSGGAGWYPAFRSRPEEFLITVVAPAGWQAVTVGASNHCHAERGKSCSGWRVAEPVDEIPLSAGPYIIRSRRLGGVDIATYFYGDNDRLSDKYLDAAACYLQEYDALLGPYPFSKFAVVENFFPTGYGFPSYTLLGTEVIRLPFILNTSLPHEIAHSWWGNGVLVDYSRGNWCEGLVTYLADHRMEEQKSPEAAREYRYRILADYAALVAKGGDFPLRKFTSRVDVASRSVGYGKGAMVFHMVRGKMGDAAFYKALRKVYRERLFAEASWEDFTAAFNAQGPENFSHFMSQWLDRKGGPQLRLEKVAAEQMQGRWRITGRVRQGTPAYDLTLKVKLLAEGGETESSLAVAGEVTPFVLWAESKPRKVVLDPDIDLFRLLAPSEVPASVNRIKGASSLLVVVGDQCKAEGDLLEYLLQVMGQKPATVISEKDLKPAALHRHDLLFCGVPKTSLPFPPGMAIGATEFTVNGRSFSGPDFALFASIPHPHDAQRGAALFLPLSRGAAEASIRKIPHYGKYGYLVFRNGDNVDKGTLPAEEDRTVFEFPQAERR